MPEGGLLVALAHPDDESLVGGTMALYADRGVPVTLLCATRGEVGEIAAGTGATPETLGEFRERELREAAQILGVVDVRLLDYRDSGMHGTADNDDPRALARADASRVVDQIIRVIEEVRPKAVITWDETGGYGHPDHIAIYRHATAAFDAVIGARRGPTPIALFYSVIPIAEFGAAISEMRARGIDVGEPPGDAEAMVSMPRVDANCVIDVSAQYDRKIQALEAHKTQTGSFGSFAQMPDDVSRRLFSSEYFFRARPPLDADARLDDLFADVR